MSTCKAIRQEGAVKGTQCKFPAGENGYCGRHQRNKQYDDGVADGTIWCRFFFRGCSNSVATTGTACTTCKDTLRADKPQCNHEGCNRSAKQEEKYCGKHERDKYKDQEVELGINYCDIARSCFNLCVEGRSSCESCLEKARECDNKRYAVRKEIHKVINIVHKSQPPLQLCCYCGKDFEPFITKHNKPSQACTACNESHTKQEVKRVDRVVNYPQRRANNSDTHYAQYRRSATIRNIPFELEPEEFRSIVCQPCFYCGTVTEGESIGIDRCDNSKGYTVDNCKPCCDTCNRMKWTFHPCFFIEKCKILAGNPKQPDFFQLWNQYYTRPTPIYSHYKYDATKRGYEFALTREEFETLITNPCYMCNYDGVTGIDRKDNTIGYIITNCRSCCYSCNMSKADIEHSKVIQTAHMIAANWHNTTALEIPVLPTQAETLKKAQKERKGWKAVSLYTALKNAQYTNILSTLSGIANTEELQALRHNIESLSYADGVTLLKKYLNTANARRARSKKNATESSPDTITHA